MIIGFVDIAKKPRFIVKTTAMLAHHYGLEIIYFTQDDVDMQNRTVHGNMFINNRWIKVKESLPIILDTTVRCYRKPYRNVMNYLRKKTIVTFDKANTPNKGKFQQVIENDPNLSSLVIPTNRLNEFNLHFKFKLATLVL